MVINRALREAEAEDYPQSNPSGSLAEVDSDERSLTCFPIGLLMFPAGPAPAVVQTESAKAERVLPKTSDVSAPIILWLLALLLFGFGDTLTSIMVFGRGGYEANPLMAGLVSTFGGGIVTFVIIKTVVVIALAVISFVFLPKHGWVVPTLLCAMGAYLVVHNSIWLVIGG